MLSRTLFDVAPQRMILSCEGRLLRRCEELRNVGGAAIDIACDGQLAGGNGDVHPHGSGAAARDEYVATADLCHVIVQRIDNAVAIQLWLFAGDVQRKDELLIFLPWSAAPARLRCRDIRGGDAVHLNEDVCAGDDEHANNSDDNQFCGESAIIIPIALALSLRRCGISGVSLRTFSHAF